MTCEITDGAAWSARLDALTGHESNWSRARLVVLIATADEHGCPHLTTADRILPQPEGLVAVSGWLCPTTVRNLKHNPKLALVVRAGQAGQGSVQIEGQVDTIQEDVTLDGYARDEARESALPQVRWVLHVHPERFFRFTDGLHSDEPLGASDGRLTG